MDQKQLGGATVYFTLQAGVDHLEKPRQEKAGTEAEVMK